MNKNSVYTFDPKSVDEKGIFNNGLRSHDNLNPNVSSNKTLPSTTPFTLSNNTKENNTNGVFSYKFYLNNQKNTNTEFLNAKF